MGFTANEVWGTTPPGVQIPPSPRLAPVLDRGLLRSRADQGGSTSFIRAGLPPAVTSPAPARPVAGRLTPAGGSGWQDRPMSSNTEFDAIIVGGGHNGLAAAAYLAKAGRDVLVLEKLEHAGGAAVSAHAFDGVDARLSRYSYLVSLLPAADHRRPRPAHHAGAAALFVLHPGPADGSRALLVDNGDAAATAASFAAVGAPDGEFGAFTAFYAALPAAHRGPLAHHDRAAAGRGPSEGPRRPGRGRRGVGGHDRTSRSARRSPGARARPGPRRGR